jgi:hypothetical protein
MLVLALTLASSTPPPSPPARGFADGVFTSAAAPALRLRVAEGLRYLGRLEFPLFGVAHVERHVFADAREGRAERSLILQFERFLPKSDDEYRYPITDPVEMCGERYRQDVFVYDAAAAARERPDAEVGHTQRFLRAKGIETAEDVMHVRFARILPDRRSEILIFYTEPVRATGRARAAHEDGEGGFKAEHAPLARALRARARAAFTILCGA